MTTNKNLAAIVMVLLFTVTSFCIPPKRFNDKPTDFNYYSNKYENFRELEDSLVYYPDTIFIYRACGQTFAFNQAGKLMENNHSLWKK